MDEQLDNFPDVMSVSQLAKALSIGRNSAYSLLHSGEIAYRKIGKKYLIPKRCIFDYLNASNYNGAVMTGQSTCQERSKL